MNCAEIRSILPDYFDEELEEILVMEVEEHLASCQGCRENVGQLRTMIEAIRSAPKQRAPTGLAEAVARQIRTETGPVAPPVTTPRLAAGFQPMRMVRALAAAAVLALALGLGAHVYNVLFEEEAAVDELTTTAPTDDLAKKREKADAALDLAEADTMIERPEESPGREAPSELWPDAEPDVFDHAAELEAPSAEREQTGEAMPSASPPAAAKWPQEFKRAKPPRAQVEAEIRTGEPAPAAVAKGARRPETVESASAAQSAPPLARKAEAGVSQARPAERPRNEIWIRCADPAIEVKLTSKMLATEAADKFPSVKPVPTRSAKAKAPEGRDEGFVLTGLTTPRKWDAFLVRLKKDKSLQWRRALLGKAEPRAEVQTRTQQEPAPDDAQRLVRFRLYFLRLKKTPVNANNAKQ